MYKRVGGERETGERERERVSRTLNKTTGAETREREVCAVGR